MRIDKYLKVSRIIKRRTIAQEACDKGRVLINGKIAKPGSVVQVGDILEINFASNSAKYEILDVKEHAKKEETSLMYRIVE